jgi:hypothetical protein
VTAPVVLLRTRAFRTSTDQELVDEARVAELARAGARVLRFDGRGLVVVDR